MTPIVQGAFSKFYTKGLQKELLKEYNENELISYEDPPFLKDKKVDKDFSLGFIVSNKIVEDDLYDKLKTKGNKMPKGKLKVKIDYSIDINYLKVTYTSGEDAIRFGFNSINISELSRFHKALNTLAKLSKQNAKKKLRSKPSKPYFPSLPKKRGRPRKV